MTHHSGNEVGSPADGPKPGRDSFTPRLGGADGRESDSHATPRQGFRMKTYRCAALLVALALLLSTASLTQAGTVRDVPLCGNREAGPEGARADGVPRKCGTEQARTYAAKYEGIGYDVLRLESEFCFAPDELFKLLDAIVEECVSDARALPNDLDQRTKVVRVSEIIGATLVKHNFGLLVPTEMLGDALEFRNKQGEPERHVFDCDTSSLIYMTVGDNLGLPVALVEIDRSGGLMGHNYIRWILPDGAVDWDTNGRYECATPPTRYSFEGKSMTREQTMGYAYSMRALFLGRSRRYALAVTDYREAIKRYPESPLASNNLAWMISTKEFAGKAVLKGDALQLAKSAVAKQRVPNFGSSLR